MFIYFSIKAWGKIFWKPSFCISSKGFGYGQIFTGFG